ncbi:MAG: class I SAM-dependent methyltransferase [Candidatus Paceibacterota bacterium]
MSRPLIQYAGRDLEAMFSAPNYCAWILSQFEPYLGQTVAEVGAGSGNFSSELVKKVSGRLLLVEPSVQMFPLLEQRFAGNPRVTCEQHYFAEVALHYCGTLDSIVYVNVLEHVEDDRQELAEAYNALKPGGHLCVFVPALPLLFSEFDASVGHYRRYSRQQLAARMREAGFEIVKLRFFDFAGILPWLLFMKLLHWRLTPGSAGLYDRIVVPLMRKAESLISPPVGKNLMVVGRKPVV